MENRKEKIYLSSLDSDRFGFKIARAIVDDPSDIDIIKEYCRYNEVTMLIARCATSCIEAVQAMEWDGYKLMDTLIYYRRSLVKKVPFPEINKTMLIREFRQDDEPDIKKIAIQAFRGYMGHYHADNRLPRSLCDESYVSWAVNSCHAKELADIVMVAEIDHEVAGFHTLRMNDSTEGEAVLTCVAPVFQGRGIYREFEIRGMLWCFEQGARSIVLSTQITNIAVQRVWVRLGFEPSHSYYTLHRWFT